MIVDEYQLMIILDDTHEMVINNEIYPILKTDLKILLYTNTLISTVVSHLTVHTLFLNKFQ